MLAFHYEDNLQGGGEEAGLRDRRDRQEAQEPGHRRQVEEVLSSHPKGIKCSAKNEVDIAEFLSEVWDEAIQQGWHIWVLMKEHVLLSDTAPLHIYHRQEESPSSPGYSIACWTCGLTYPARRRRAVLTTSCAAARLIQHDDPWGTRISARSCVQAGFTQFLERLNKDPARVGRHWPSITERIVGNRMQVWLLCGKCGKQVYHAGKHAFLREKCEQDRHLMAVLPLPDREEERGDVPLLLAPPVPEERGGQSCTVASLNVGSLRGKELLLHDLGQGCHPYYRKLAYIRQDSNR